MNIELRQWYFGDEQALINLYDNYDRSFCEFNYPEPGQCDESDANIGYPTMFQGSYTAQEYVAGHGVDGTGYFPKVVPATET